MQPGSRRDKKILQMKAAAAVATVSLATLFLNCSGSSFTAASIDGNYSQQSYTIDIAISVQPATSTMMVGNSLTLSVAASGKSTLYYQWYKDGTAVDTASNSSYTISGATADDAGAYCVIVWDASGSVISSNATVTVSANPSSPMISVQPASAVGSVGGSASFSVSATGTSSGGSLRYQWFHNSDAISGATNSVYTVTSITSADAGSYYVAVTNSVTTITSSSVTLSIVSGP